MTVSLDEKALGKATFDFLETLGHISLLTDHGVFQPVSNAKDNLKWQAFSIAALICYSRPFLRSDDLPKFKEELENQLSSDSKRELHKKFIRRRSKLIAHSDGELFEIQVMNTSKSAMSLHSADKYLNKDETEELRLLASEMLNIVTRLRSQL